MKNTHSIHQAVIEALEQKRRNKLFTRLLRTLINWSGVASREQIEELHAQIRDLTEYVEIIARQVKRETDSQEKPSSAQPS